MIEKRLNGRIVHKGDIEANWKKAVGFVPLAKEIIIYLPDENYDYSRMKIGDGITSVNDLPFESQQADWDQNDNTKKDYIKNKPFGVKQAFEPITWDGNIEGRDRIDLSAIANGIYLIKVSDEILDYDMLLGSTLNVSTLEGVVETKTLLENELMPKEMGEEVGFYINQDFEFISCFDVDKANATVNGEFTLPSTGIYFIANVDVTVDPNNAIVYVSSISKEEVIKIDEKYIPDAELSYSPDSKKPQSGVAVAEALEDKLDKSGGLIGGDLSVQGNLSVTGTTTTKDTETILVKDNVIVANSDGNELLEEAGFAVKTGAAAAYGIMYDPVGDGVKIGLGAFDENGKFEYTEGEDQFLATRDDEITDGNLVKWDNEKKKLVDAGDEYVKFTDWASATTPGVIQVPAIWQNKGITRANTNPILEILPTTNTLIDERKGLNPVVPENIDYAMMSALADCKQPELWTDDTTENGEAVQGTKSKARELLGAVGKEDYAALNKAGVVKLDGASYSGINIKDGKIFLMGSNKNSLADSFFNSPKSYGVAVTSNYLYRWIKVGLTQNDEEWTDDTTDEEGNFVKGDKTKARETLGSVGFTDYANDKRAGLVKSNPGGGIQISEYGDGLGYTSPATNDDIAGKGNRFKPITPANHDYAWKIGATTNTEEWTDDDKTAACETIGALPLSGGTMTGEIVLGQGDNKGINLGDAGVINSGVHTVLGFLSGGLVVGAYNRQTTLRTAINSKLKVQFGQAGIGTVENVATEKYVDDLVGNINTALEAILGV